jgi:hypothetical protein
MYPKPPVAAVVADPGSTVAVREAANAEKLTMYFTVISMHRWIRPKIIRSRNIIMMIVSVAAWPRRFHTRATTTPTA